MNAANAERARRDPKYRLFYGSLPPSDPRHVPLDPADWCRHLGAPTGEAAPCQECNATRDVPLYACGRHGRASLATLAADTACCRVCPDRETPPPAPRPGDPACGVVVGCWRWPSVAELQVRAIRRHCGPVPVLLCVDPDPGHPDWPSRRERYLDLASHDNVWVDLHPARLGHTAGDLRAFAAGLRWAQMLGLDYVCKLSHRFVWDTPRWLQAQARALAPTGLPASGAECLQSGLARWPIRAECLLLDVRQWDAGAVTPAGRNAEHTVWQVLQRTGPGNYLPWPGLGAERNRRRPGYLWHGPNTLQDYWRLAQSLGVLLDADLSVTASGGVQGYEP